MGSETVLADVETERAFLGVLLWEGSTDPRKAVALSGACGLFPQHFFDETARTVFAAAIELAKANRPTDTASMAAALRGKLEHPANVLAEIEVGAGVRGAVQGYSEIIRGYALRRRLVEVAQQLRSDACREAVRPVEVLAKYTRTLAGINVRSAANKTLADVLDGCIETVERNCAGQVPDFVRTGLSELDNLLGGGLQPSVLTLVGAEPGVGKSAILASIASSAAKAGKKIGVFSLEDEASWLGWRVLAQESGIHQPILKCRKLNDTQRERLVGGVDRISEYDSRVVIDDRSGLTPGEICQAASAMVVNDGVQAILVDHLGEVKFDAGKRDRYDLAVGEGLREMRDVAKRHGIPVVVASQLARRNGRKPGDCPVKADFKNSGDIEAVARVMLGLAREPGADTLKVGVLKNTNGLAGVEIELQFHGVAAMVRDCEGAAGRDYYAQEGGR